MGSLNKVCDDSQGLHVINYPPTTIVNFQILSKNLHRLQGIMVPNTEGRKDVMEDVEFVDLCRLKCLRRLGITLTPGLEPILILEDRSGANSNPTS